VARAFDMHYEQEGVL